MPAQCSLSDAITKVLSWCQEDMRKREVCLVVNVCRLIIMYACMESDFVMECVLCVAG